MNNLGDMFVYRGTINYGSVSAFLYLKPDLILCFHSLGNMFTDRAGSNWEDEYWKLA